MVNQVFRHNTEKKEVRAMIEEVAKGRSDAGGGEIMANYMFLYSFT